MIRRLAILLVTAGLGIGSIAAALGAVDPSSGSEGVRIVPPQRGTFVRTPTSKHARVVVTVVNQPAQQPDVVPASSCDYTFGGCGVGYSPGWAYPGFTYYVPPFRRGFNKPDHHRKWVATPTRQRSLIPPLIPYTMHPPGGRRLG